jgi:hypothetical protein
MVKVVNGLLKSAYPAVFFGNLLDFTILCFLSSLVYILFTSANYRPYFSVIDWTLFKHSIFAFFYGLYILGGIQRHSMGAEMLTFHLEIAAFRLEIAAFQLKS